MVDEIYDYPMTNHIRTKAKEIPYNRMSQLAKDVHDARELGMTYGHYMAHKQGPMPHKHTVTIGGTGRYYVV